MGIWDSFAADPNDTADDRVEKRAAFVVAGSCCLAGCVWTAMYLYVFGWGVVAALPAAFVVIVGTALVLSHFTREIRIAVYAQIVCIIFITALIQWNVGAAYASGLVMMWGFLGPITALVFFSVRQSIFWFCVFLSVVIITFAFNDTFAAGGETVSSTTSLVFGALNLSVASMVVFAFAGYFVTQAVAERERANRLLLNVLPRQIAPRLKESDSTIAEYYDSASVLFADIVGSTPLFAELDPADAVDWLNQVFSMFDALVDRHGLEKIRTIGDNYMVAAGVPARRNDHADAIVLLALDMLDGLRHLPPRDGKRMDFRIGINSGPLVAGVIGTHKFHYDVWGDTVNTASRMESHGQPGRIQISDATRELLTVDVPYEPRGTIDVKGKGTMETFLLAPPAPLS